MWKVGLKIRPLHAAENEMEHCLTQQVLVQQQRKVLALMRKRSFLDGRRSAAVAP